MEMKKIIVPFEIKQFDESDDDFFTFKGFASTFGTVDLGDDVIEPGAFTETLAEKTGKGEQFPAMWQHRYNEPIGIYPSVKEESKGLFVEGKLPKSDTFVSGRVIPQMKIGSVTKLSIGYSVYDNGSFEIIDGIRHIKKLKLYEISLVTFPMNEEASITEMKKEKLISRIDDFKSLTDRELEEVLNTGASFSGKNAKIIISALKAAGLRDGDSDGHRDGENWDDAVAGLKEIQQLLEEKANA